MQHFDHFFESQKFIEPPKFKEPWHAQIFAMTIALYEQGLFSWPEWSARFSAHLADKNHQNPDPVDKDDGYYLAWFSALSGLLSDKSITHPQEIENMRACWQHAFETTAHGQPVHLTRDEEI